MKSVRTRSYSGPYFPAFGLNAERAVRMRKNTDRKTPTTDTLYAVHKTFRRRPGHLMDVLGTLNLRPVSRGMVVLNPCKTAHPRDLSQLIFHWRVYFLSQTSQLSVLHNTPYNELCELKGALSDLTQLLATESHLKMMKDGFYFILKALFVLKIFRSCVLSFGHVEKRLDYRGKVSFRIYYFTAWKTNNCNAHIAQ